MSRQKYFWTPAQDALLLKHYEAAGAFELVLAWVLGRQMRYDRKPGGLGR